MDDQTDTRFPTAAPTSPSTDSLPRSQGPAADELLDDELLDDELLVEEISIDGMCGVY